MSVISVPVLADGGPSFPIAALALAVLPLALLQSRLSVALAVLVTLSVLLSDETQFEMRRNLMISNAAINCTPVVRDILVVSLRCTLVYKPCRTARVEGIAAPSPDWNVSGPQACRDRGSTCGHSK